MNETISKKNRVIFVAALCLMGPEFIGIAQSPSTIGGRTIELKTSSGSFPFASSGSYRFLPSAVDSGYAIVPISGRVNASTGTHTYVKNGPNSAILSLVDSGVGGLTGSCIFNTPTSGTYTLTSTEVPGPKQTGTFVLYSGPSRASLGGTTITVSITSGEFPFASWGSFEFLPSSTGNTFTIEDLSGTVGNSSGTYSYSKNSEHTGIISFSDSLVGSGFTSQLSFDSPTTGTVFLRKSRSTGYQTGLFSITTPSVAPSISTHPSSQTVVAGDSVTFSVSASGTIPLAYQWRKNGVNIAGANGHSYSINSGQATDQGDYDVTVANSAGVAVSSIATLTVISPPNIVTHPSSATVSIGDSVSFRIIASGSASLMYQWSKNQVEIPGATLASFTISNVQPSDAGTYSVRVTNSAGAVTSIPANLDVNLIATERPRLSTSRWSPVTGFSAILHGQIQHVYRVQWSTNLTTWTDLTNLVPNEVMTQILDGDARLDRIRFYRAVSP